MTTFGYLPQKFKLQGHSYGGYLSSLFACAHPERIEALFLNSPVGPETMPDDYNPMRLRMSSGHYEPPSEAEHKFWKYQWESFRTPLDVARLLPHFANNHVARTFVQNDMEGYPEEHTDAFMRYFFAAYLE